MSRLFPLISAAVELCGKKIVPIIGAICSSTEQQTFLLEILHKNLNLVSLAVELKTRKGSRAFIRAAAGRTGGVMDRITGSWPAE